MQRVHGEPKYHGGFHTDNGGTQHATGPRGTTIPWSVPQKLLVVRRMQRVHEEPKHHGGFHKNNGSTQNATGPLGTKTPRSAPQN